MEVSYLSFDIETVPNEYVDQYLEEFAVVKAPGNYKDQEKIAARIEEKKGELKGKAGLYWWTGKVVCITAVDELGQDYTIFSPNEKTLLEEFLTLLKTKYPKHLLLGKNSRGFDIPFILGRCLHHDIGLTSHFRLKRTINDITDIFIHSSSRNQEGKLTDYAFGIGMAKTDGVSGASVKGLYDGYIFDGKEENRDLIQRYCLQDTKIVAELLRRYLKPFVPTQEEREPWCDEVPF